MSQQLMAADSAVDADPAEAPPDLRRYRGWTPIAERSRHGTRTAVLVWNPIPGARISIMQARSLATAGALLMAQRYGKDRVELVIRAPASAIGQPQPAPHAHPTDLQ